LVSLAENQMPIQESQPLPPGNSQAPSYW
jgi:hypothetical protein